MESPLRINITMKQNVYIRYQQMMALPTTLVHLIDICTKVVNDMVHFVDYPNRFKVAKWRGNVRTTLLNTPV
jgi:hypothetical protein